METGYKFVMLLVNFAKLTKEIKTIIPAKFQFLNTDKNESDFVVSVFFSEELTAEELDLLTATIAAHDPDDSENAALTAIRADRVFGVGIMMDLLRELKAEFLPKDVRRGFAGFHLAFFLIESGAIAAAVEEFTDGTPDDVMTPERVLKYKNKLLVYLGLPPE